MWWLSWCSLRSFEVRFLGPSWGNAGVSGSAYFNFNRFRFRFFPDKAGKVSNTLQLSFYHWLQVVCKLFSVHMLLQLNFLLVSWLDWFTCPALCCFAIDFYPRTGRKVNPCKSHQRLSHSMPALGGICCKLPRVCSFSSLPIAGDVHFCTFLPFALLQPVFWCDLH